MAFTLQLTDQLVTFDDDASYRFNDAGMLVVREADNRRRIFSPAAWVWLEDTITPGRAGGAGGPGGGRAGDST